MKQIVFAVATLLLAGCTGNTDTVVSPFDTADLNHANRRLLEVAMEDGFPPPIASRVYVYPHIAHYTTLQLFYPDSLPDITTKLNGLTPLSGVNTQSAQPELAALIAFCRTGKKVVFSEHYMDALAEHFIENARTAGMRPATIEASVRAGEEITAHIAQWTAKDNYVQTRTMDRFTSTKRPGEWRETPPDYIAGLEPHWPKIRPMVIDSAAIYPAAPLPPYDADKDSDFYKMVNQVYEESKTLDDEKIEIAWFWDDNPNVTEHRGHSIIMIHKISPPGHWLNIIHQVSAKEGSSLFKTSKAYTWSAIAMFDGIISCWYEKYNTNLVRPISYIQEYIDINWRPLIQTPPFPEYTSGHSVISASAAEVLTHIYGDNYAFVDSTNLIFEQPVRSFKSFHDAAWEVSLSRYYGGIHYFQGIEEGNKQGKFIGRYALNKLSVPSAMQ